jgi:hypothetical protein
VYAALLALILVAAVPHLFLAGGGLARMAVQIPARRVLGPVAFAHYSRHADLGPGGLTLYPLLGVGGPLATWAALVVAYAARAAATVKLSLAARQLPPGRLTDSRDARGQGAGLLAGTPGSGSRRYRSMAGPAQAAICSGAAVASGCDRST